MAEKNKDEAKAEIKLQVVAQLPTTPTDVGIGNDGQTYKLITIEDALTELLVSIREIKKALIS